MAKEYVEKEAVERRIFDHAITEHNVNAERASGMMMAESIVHSFPAANVRENVTGEWIEDRTEIVCPNCCSRYSDEIVFMNRNMKDEPLNFCPNCGADMRGGDDD